MKFVTEYDQEADGRHIAEVPSIPGVMAYGASAEEAGLNAAILALRVLADRMERREVTRDEAEIVGSMFIDESDMAAKLHEKYLAEEAAGGAPPRPWREVVAEMGIDPDDLGPDDDQADSKP